MAIQNTPERALKTVLVLFTWCRFLAGWCCCAVIKENPSLLFIVWFVLKRTLLVRIVQRIIRGLDGL